MTTFYYYPIDNNLSPFLNKIDHESLPGSFTWLIFIEQVLKRLAICFLFTLMMIYYCITYFYNGSCIHISIKIFNFELISSILQIPLSNNFLVYSNPMIFSDKICLDLVYNNIRKFYSFLHDQGDNVESELLVGSLKHHDSCVARVGQHGGWDWL